MTWNAWEKIEKFHISETLRSPKHSSQHLPDPEILGSGQGRDSLWAAAQRSVGGWWVTMTRVRHEVNRCYDQTQGHYRCWLSLEQRSPHYTIKCPRAPWWGREPHVPRVSGRIVPAQVVSPDPLSRLAANTKPKQTLVNCKNKLLLSAHACFQCFHLSYSVSAQRGSSVILWPFVFSSKPLWASQPWDTQRSFHSRQKKSVKRLHKSQHRHYNSNGPFPFYHSSSSQKAHNWFLLTNSLFFRYVVTS